MIDFLGARAIRGIEAVDGRRCYRRSIALDGAQGVIRIEPDDREPALLVSIRFPHVSALAGIVRRVRHIFDLSADPLAIRDDLGRDPLLAPLVAERPGLRVPGAWDGFEVAIRAILGQQITVVAAVNLAAKLVAESRRTFAVGLRKWTYTQIPNTGQNCASSFAWDAGCSCTSAIISRRRCSGRSEPV